MALSTPTLLTENFDGTNRASGTAYTTASITPTANAQVFIVVYLNASVTAVIPTISGNGLTWVLVNSQKFNASDINLVALFRASGASPTTGAVSINIGHNCTQAMWKVFEVTGQHATTPVPQSAVGTGTGTTASATLAAFGAAGNATLLCAANSGGITATFTHEGGSWQNIGSGLFNTSPNANLHAFWLAGNDTSPSSTIGASVVWAAVAAEVAEAAGGGPTGNPWYDSAQQ